MPVRSCIRTGMNDGSRPAPVTATPPARDAERIVAESEHVVVLRGDGKTYYLLGTAYVSEQSVRDARELIQAVRPDTVCVELCETRWEVLADEGRWRQMDMFRIVREGKSLLLLANLALTALQRHLGAQLGIHPARDLRAAMEESEGVGAEVRLVDRAIETTLHRTWARLSALRRMQLLGAVIHATVSSRHELDEETVQRLQGRAHLSDMLAEFARRFPEVRGPLVEERDSYLMSRIEEAEGPNVVAIVGATHLPGMQRAFGNPVDRASLELAPRPGRVGRALKWAIPVLLLAAFAVGISGQAGRSFEELLLAWVLPNSVFSGVLTMAVGGTIPSILASFLTSPITSLNPLVGNGFIVGILETWIRKPTVEDAERVHEDSRSIKGLFRNRFTRVLLVVFAASVGSNLGAWLGLAWVVALLT